MIVTCDVQTQKVSVQKKDHPVKVTALACAREAISEERYEEVKEMIDIAREFGATYWDIRLLLMTRV